MEPRYLWLLNYSYGAVTVIRLTNEEVEKSAEYDDFENFISSVLENKYEFRLRDCCWMTTENYDYEQIGF